MNAALTALVHVIAVFAAVVFSVFALVGCVGAVCVGLGACMRSSQLSREEERAAFDRAVAQRLAATEPTAPTIGAPPVEPVSGSRTVSSPAAVSIAPYLVDPSTPFGVVSPLAGDARRVRILE